jgi:ketosteroid isomerase-like protein
MAHENVEVVRRTIELAEQGIRQGDSGAAFDECVTQGLIAPNLEWRGGSRGGAAVAGLDDAVGRAGYVEFMDRWTEGFDDYAIESEQIIDAGNHRVVATTRASGTGRGSRVRVDIREGMVFTFDAQCVVRITLFLDPDSALKAAGLSE